MSTIPVQVLSVDSFWYNSKSASVSATTAEGIFAVPLTVIMQMLRSGQDFCFDQQCLPNQARIDVKIKFPPDQIAGLRRLFCA